MHHPPRPLSFSSPDETARWAAALGARLLPGDTVLLQGEVGAGKTHLARSLIQSLLATPEDVPSPTFTLVQTYDTARGEVWHADLYRLTSTQEIEELGLTEAFETAICLVEWPDRLGPLIAPTALAISLESGTTDEGRHMELTWQDPKWHDRIPSWPI